MRQENKSQRYVDRKMDTISATSVNMLVCWRCCTPNNMEVMTGHPLGVTTVTPTEHSGNDGRHVPVLSGLNRVLQSRKVTL